MADLPLQRRSVLGGAVALGAAAGLRTAPAAQAKPRPDDGRRKAILITGCSSGFGRLSALTLARAGHQVYASMRDTRTTNANAAKDLGKLAAEERLQLSIVDLDVRDDRSVTTAVRHVAHQAGRIDVLVNNAGIFHPAILETLTISDVQRTFDTNLFGPLRMNRAVLPYMRDREDGLIVQITTALARFVMPFLGAYCGSKWALEAMTEITRYEVSQQGIDVVIVEPGPYNTDFVDPNGTTYYRQYLRRLTADNARRRTQYGELARRAENHLAEDSDANPQEIADAIKTLIDTPRGQRPIRLVGPGLTDFVGPINEATQNVTHAVMQDSGFGDLIT